MEHLLRYDHYKVLGVPRDASPQKIKRAYRERVKQCHPDRNNASNAPFIFQAVQEAYETLRNVERRAKYDERLRFYREAGATDNFFQHEYRKPQRRRVVEEEPDRPVHKFAFVGLHLTGLIFGVTLVAGILLGITLWNWPAYTLFFCVPGIAVIPDSISGLRAK